jgi:hypothetical protein
MFTQRHRIAPPIKAKIIWRFRQAPPPEKTTHAFLPRPAGDGFKTPSTQAKKFTTHGTRNV